MSVQSIEITFGDTLDVLVSRAVRADIPADLAQKARAATARALHTAPSARASVSLRRRAEAYFEAVVRRNALRGCAGPTAAARLIAAAVVEDLKETGRDAADIWEELERGWGSRLPGDVLEEYRLRLCS